MTNLVSSLNLYQQFTMHNINVKPARLPKHIIHGLQTLRCGYSLHTRQIHATLDCRTQYIHYIKSREGKKCSQSSFDLVGFFIPYGACFAASGPAGDKNKGSPAEH
jgi:hypothetical protein